MRWIGYGMIRLTHVSKSFDKGHSYAVKDLSLRVEQGEALVLLGSSGCGKTTTLKMINPDLSDCRDHRGGERAAREGRNPSTDEKMQIQASKGVKFTPGTALKKRFNK